MADSPFPAEWPLPPLPPGAVYGKPDFQPADYLPPGAAAPAVNSLSPFTSHPLDDAAIRLLRQDLRLPIHMHVMELREAASDKRPTCVTGATGCGKSTYLPQVISNVERLYNGWTGSRIWHTTPRVSAGDQLLGRLRSLTADCRGMSCIAYYQGTRDNVIAKDWEIVAIHTTVTALLRLGELVAYGEKAVENRWYIPHLIIDEADLRDVHTRLLRFVGLHLHRKGLLHLWLVSATLDAEPDAEFRTVYCGGRPFPILIVPVFVADFATSTETAACLAAAAAPVDATTIVFVPGHEDAVAGCEKVRAEISSDTRLQTHCLSGKSSCADIKKLEARVEPGETRVAFGTEGISRGMTLNNVAVVIDTSLCKRPRVESGVRVLRLELATHQDAEQRRGRAGRTCAATCFVFEYSPGAVVCGLGTRLPSEDAADFFVLAINTAKIVGIDLRTLATENRFSLRIDGTTVADVAVFLEASALPFLLYPLPSLLPLLSPLPLPDSPEHSTPLTSSEAFGCVSRNSLGVQPTGLAYIVQLLGVGMRGGLLLLLSVLQGEETWPLAVGCATELLALTDHEFTKSLKPGDIPCLRALLASEAETAALHGVPAASVGVAPASHPSLEPPGSSRHGLLRGSAVGPLVPPPPPPPPAGPRSSRGSADGVDRAPLSDTPVARILGRIQTKEAKLQQLLPAVRAVLRAMQNTAALQTLKDLVEPSLPTIRKKVLRALAVASPDHLATYATELNCYITTAGVLVKPPQKHTPSCLALLVAPKADFAPHEGGVRTAWDLRFETQATAEMLCDLDGIISRPATSLTVVISDSLLFLYSPDGGSWPRLTLARLLGEAGHHKPLLLFRPGLRLLELYCLLCRVERRLRANERLEALVIVYNLNDLVKPGRSARSQRWFSSVLARVAVLAATLSLRVVWVTSSPSAFPAYREDRTYQELVGQMFDTLGRCGLACHDPVQRLRGAQMTDGIHVDESHALTLYPIMKDPFPSCKPWGSISCAAFPSTSGSWCPVSPQR